VRQSINAFPWSAWSMVLGGALLNTAACKDASTLPIASAKRTLADSADQIAFGMRTLITDRGLLRAEVLSDTAYFFDENTRLEMRGGPTVNGVFFNSVGAKEAVMSSRTGLYNTRSQLLEARGDVVITSVDGRHLETPFLRFDQRLNQISSESTFVLTEPGRVIRGIGFTSDPDMQNIRVWHVLSAKAGAVAVPEK
jgi:LPS export ABC transporter protein LptC